MEGNKEGREGGREDGEMCQGNVPISELGVVPN